MKKVIVIMALLVSGTVAGAYQLYQLVPVPIATAVIAEKPEKIMGGQNAVLLPETLSEKQSHLLNTAYTIAQSNGFKSPEIVQSILLQETKAGGMHDFRVANAEGEPYFGVMQIKLRPAKEVLSRNPDLYKKYAIQGRTDDEVKANLILNDSFNIEVATRYLRFLKDQYGYSGDMLKNAYNRGPEGVKSVGVDYHYAQEANKKLAAYKAKL